MRIEKDVSGRSQRPASSRSLVVLLMIFKIKYKIPLKTVE